MIMEVPSATLELLDATYTEHVDGSKSAARPVSGSGSRSESDPTVTYGFRA